MEQWSNGALEYITAKPLKYQIQDLGDYAVDLGAYAEKHWPLIGCHISEIMLDISGIMCTIISKKICLQGLMTSPPTELVVYKIS